jgi:membrane protein DedA with SNARE-associated domain
MHLIRDLLSDWGIWGIFVLMFAENLGLALPTELGFLAGQSMVAMGQQTYLSIFLVMLIAKTAGSILTYFVGRYLSGKVKAIETDKFGLKRAQQTFSKWMSKYGDVAVFISRLIGYVRPWSSYLAGAGEIKFLPFLFYNVTGSAVITLLSMFVLKYVYFLWGSYPSLRIPIIVVMIILFFGFWFWFWFKSRKKKVSS